MKPVLDLYQASDYTLLIIGEGIQASTARGMLRGQYFRATEYVAPAESISLISINLSRGNEKVYHQIGTSQLALGDT